MPKGDKYAGLTDYLIRNGGERQSMTFDMLEGICGLPASAYQYPACWVNSAQNSLCHGWLLAGYVVERCSIPARQVTFRRDPKLAREYLEREGRRAPGCGPSRRRTASADKGAEPEALLRAGEGFLERMEDDPHARYRSWEHCYLAFSAARKGSADLDFLSLHLAWYLASWGMLRGGTFLLQKDYKIHLPATAFLLEDRWSSLTELDRESLARGDFAGQVMELSGELSQTYRREAGETPSDTLLTKILLGTLGCVPAYDRYFKWAARETGVARGAFSKGSLQALGRLYAGHWEAWEALREKCSRRVVYPPMKIIDMCLFQYGLERQPKLGAGKGEADQVFV